METVFDEKMIRDEFRRLDEITGLHAAELQITFGNAKSVLGRFSYKSEDELKFYFSNYYFQDPELPVEEKLNTIRHEYAHYMDYMLHGESSHGPLWKQCCIVVGAIPVRCFSRERATSLLAMHEKERKLNEVYDEFTVGREISHSVFGVGKIIRIMGEGVNRIASVDFEQVGVKRLAISWINTNCKIS